MGLGSGWLWSATSREPWSKSHRNLKRNSRSRPRNKKERRPKQTRSRPYPLQIELNGGVRQGLGSIASPTHPWAEFVQCTTSDRCVVLALVALWRDRSLARHSKSKRPRQSNWVARISGGSAKKNAEALWSPMPDRSSPWRPDNVHSFRQGTALTLRTADIRPADSSPGLVYSNPEGRRNRDGQTSDAQKGPASGHSSGLGNRTPRRPLDDLGF